MSAALRVPALTCSTCDDYRLVPGDDGMLVRCPDCLYTTATRCPAHGRSLVKGKCPECRYEAVAAEESIILGLGRADDPVAEALFSDVLIERARLAKEWAGR